MAKKWDNSGSKGLFLRECNILKSGSIFLGYKEQIEQEKDRIFIIFNKIMDTHQNGIVECSYSLKKWF